MNGVYVVVMNFASLFGITQPYVDFGYFKFYWSGFIAWLTIIGLTFLVIHLFVGCFNLVKRILGLRK